MALAPTTYFAAGTTQANMTNIELTSGVVFHVIDFGSIPLVNPVKTRALDGMALRNGKIVGRLVADVPLDSQRRALNTMLFGNQTTDGRELYVSAIDEDRYYSPFLAFVDRPVEIDDYQPVTGGVYNRALVLTLFHCRAQSATKTSNYTVTTSDRLLYADTSGGNVTFALPAVAGVTPFTIWRFVKTAAANSMILDGNGSETIAGNTTHTSTALNASVSIYTPDNLVWLVA